MRNPGYEIGLLSVLTFFGASSASIGQSVSVGVGPLADTLEYARPVDFSVPRTSVNLTYGATQTGLLTVADFGWSATGCPVAVKIKFFRGLHFLAERGPFDVTAPVQTSPRLPPVTQTVVLDPPVAVQQGDLIGITNLTSCGGPAILGLARPIPLPDPIFFSVTYAGDVVSDATLGTGTSLGPGYVDVSARDDAGLPLLGTRFQATLSATDPRTGVHTIGFAHPLGNGAGYFSLPAFTGDAAFPEMMVKMVDATDAAPPFGGKFWFFYSAMTDVQYTLTVIDQVTRRLRTYSNGPAFCGGADTDAFPP